MQDKLKKVVLRELKDGDTFYDNGIEKKVLLIREDTNICKVSFNFWGNEHIDYINKNKTVEIIDEGE